jgi:hypothetical protein
MILFMIAFLLPALSLAAQVGRVTGLKGTAEFRAKNNIPYSPIRSGGQKQVYAGQQYRI